MFSHPKDKAFRLELKADKLESKGKFRKALTLYLEALEILPERIELYDKALAVMEEEKEQWSEEDFTLNVFLTMQKQEILDPTFKRIHARAEYEFKEVTALIKKLMKAKDTKEETQIVEEIYNYGEHSLYPLMDFLLSLKEAGKNAAKKAKSNSNKEKK